MKNLNYKIISNEGILQLETDKGQQFYPTELAA